MLAQAKASASRRAAGTMTNQGGMKTVLLALLAGGELAEHDAPPAATLMCLTGTADFFVGAQITRLEAGQILAIPPVRHSVTAVTDCTVLLTIARGPAPAPVEVALGTA